MADRNDTGDTGPEASGMLATTGVLKHPTFGNPPVANERRPGRKRGAINLSAERYKRWLKSTPAPDPEPFPVELPLRKTGRYIYPKSMLYQAYFCRGGTGIWSNPKRSLSMLANPKFVSPVGALLDQLEDESHDVSGARAEWKAFRELSSALELDVKALWPAVFHLTERRPISLQFDDGGSHD